MRSGAEIAPRVSLELPDVIGDLGHQSFRETAAVEIVQTGLSAYDESGRNIEPELRHLAKIRPLAAQQFLVLAVTFGETVDPLFAHGIFR